MNPEKDHELDVDPNHGNAETANDIVRKIISERNTMEDMQIIGKPLLMELIINLDKAKDKNHIMNICLTALAEHVGLISLLGDNLKEATDLLRKHNIPFNSMVGADDES